jgi:hypothetical protein
MRRAVVWTLRFAHWLRVHRNFGRARWAVDHELGAWK